MATGLCEVCTLVEKGHTKAKRGGGKVANWDNTREALDLHQRLLKQRSTVDGFIDNILGKLQPLAEEELKREVETKTHKYNHYLNSSYSKFEGLSALVRVSPMAVPKADPEDCGAGCSTTASASASACPSVLTSTTASASASASAAPLPVHHCLSARASVASESDLSRSTAHSVKDAHCCECCGEKPGWQRGPIRWTCHTCRKKVCKKCMGGTALSRAHAKGLSKTRQNKCTLCCSGP